MCMWAIVVHVAVLTISEQRAVGIMGLRNIAMAPPPLGPILAHKGIVASPQPPVSQSREPSPPEACLEAPDCAETDLHRHHGHSHTHTHTHKHTHTHTHTQTHTHSQSLTHTHTHTQGIEIHRWTNSQG